MSRCVACNSILSVIEIQGNKEDKTPEDMCASCRYKSRDRYNWVYDYKSAFDSESDIFNFINELKKRESCHDYY